MISQKDLQALVNFDQGEDLVLSLYLNTDPSEQSKEQSKLIVREYLDRVADKSLSEDVERIERFLDYEHDWRGKGIAIFSCQRRGLWEHFSLAVPVRNAVFVTNRPYIKPLTDLMDEYQPYGVVLLDQEGARFFHVHLGEITEANEADGQVVKHHKQGGWSQASYQRHADMQVLQNLKLAAETATHFCRQQECQELVLAGSEEAVAQFRALLPKTLQRNVLGTIPLGANATNRQILEHSMEIMQQAKAAEEAALIEQVVTAASKGGAAVMGLDDTAYAVREGRVRTMLVEEGYETPGAVCRECGYVSVEQGQDCLFCGNEMEPIANAVDLVVQKALDSGAKVRFPAENKALSRAGHIGAILRY
jgi:peptide chain release factor subunit 1